MVGPSVTPINKFKSKNHYVQFSVHCSANDIPDFLKNDPNILPSQGLKSHLYRSTGVQIRLAISLEVQRPILNACKSAKQQDNSRCYIVKEGAGGLQAEQGKPHVMVSPHAPFPALRLPVLLYQLSAAGELVELSIALIPNCNPMTLPFV